MNNKFNKSYISIAVVVIIIIAIIYWYSFFSPFKQNDAILQYANAQLLYSTVTILAIIFSFVYSTINYAQSLKTPDSKLIFSETKRASNYIDISNQNVASLPLYFSIENNGNNVAVWFEVIVDLNNLPTGGLRYSSPSWDEEGLHGSANKKELAFRSFGKTAVFKSKPLDIGGTNIIEKNKDGLNGTYIFPYTIYGDWGKPKKGELVLTINNNIKVSK